MTHNLPRRSFLRTIGAVSIIRPEGAEADIVNNQDHSAAGCDNQTFVGMSRRTIGREIQIVSVSGYYLPGDGGEARYRAVNAEPRHAGKFLARDGRWFEVLEDDGLDVKAFGAKGDGITNDIPAIRAAYQWACLHVREGSRTGGKIKFGRRGSYMMGDPDAGDAGYGTDRSCILTLDGCGVTIAGANDAVLTRPSGTWSTIAVQGDEHQINVVTDWNWDDATDERWPSPNLRREVFYVTGNRNKISGLCRNGPGDAVQVDGMQKFGVRQESFGLAKKLSAPTTAYSPSICGADNDFSGIRIENFFYGGIINYWSSGTVIIGATIERVGSEGITFDTYSAGFRCIGNKISEANYPGRHGGVGGIGADSAHDGLIAMNIVQDIKWSAGFTAGIHLRGDENSTTGLQILGNTLINVGGPGIHLDATLIKNTSLALAPGTVSSPKGNFIALNTFVRCGADRNFRASLGAKAPELLALLIMHDAAGPAFGNVIGINNLQHHAIIDAPLPDWSASDPTNPNHTSWGDAQQSDLTVSRGQIRFGARVEDRLLELFDNGEDRYGWGMAANEMRQYFPPNATVAFGTPSNGKFALRWKMAPDGALVPGGNFQIGRLAQGERVGAVYTTVAPNISSDARVKEIVAEASLDLALKAIDSVPIRTFRRNDLGDNRLHYGPLAQDIVRAFADRGLSAFDWDLVYQDQDTGFLGVTMATFDRMRLEAWRKFGH